MNTMILFLIWSLMPASQDALHDTWLGRFKLAENALEVEAFDEAVDLLKSCLELEPKNATTAYHLACAHARGGDLDEALAWLERAVDWGWIDADVILWDNDLSFLRIRKEYAEIAMHARRQSGSQDIKTGSEDDHLLLCAKNAASVQGCWILPDDHTVFISVEDGTLRTFDLETGQLEGVLTGHTDNISFVDITADGNMAASASRDGTARVWDLEDRKEIALFENAYPNLTNISWPAVRLHPDGDRLVTYGPLYPGTIPTRVWSVETGKLVFQVPSYGEVKDLSWSPDGSILGTAHENGTVRFWDASSGSPVGQPMRHQSPVHSLAFEASGRRVATGARNDTSVRLWAVPSGEPLTELIINGSFLFDFEVSYLAWTPKGDLITTTSAWPTIEYWDGQKLERRWHMEEFRGGNHSPLHVVPNTSCTRFYVWGMTTNHSRILDAEIGKTLWNLKNREFSDLSGTTDDRTIIAWADGGTAVLDGATLMERYRRIEYPDGEALLYTPSLVFWGNSSAIRNSHIRHDDKIYPIEQFTPILYGPKRLKAAASGVPIRRPKFSMLSFVVEEKESK